MKVIDQVYLIDKDKVYVNDRQIKGADPETFHPLKGGYTRDSYSVYYGGKKLK
jgi:hypothetical protein